MSTPTFGTAPEHHTQGSALEAELGPADAPTSLLDDLAADLANDVEPLEAIFVAVASRPGYRVRFQADLVDGNDLRRMTKASTVRGELDNVKFSTLLLAKACTGIERNGTIATDERGNPLTFQSAEFRSALGVPTVSEAVHKFYGKGRDALIVSTGEAVGTHAGWGEDVMADPTE